MAGGVHGYGLQRGGVGFLSIDQTVGFVVISSGGRQSGINNSGVSGGHRVGEDSSAISSNTKYLWELHVFHFQL